MELVNWDEKECRFDLLNGCGRVFIMIGLYVKFYLKEFGLFVLVNGGGFLYVWSKEFILFRVYIFYLVFLGVRDIWLGRRSRLCKVNKFLIVDVSIFLIYVVF